jgi:hypothetical protein
MIFKKYDLNSEILHLWQKFKTVLNLKLFILCTGDPHYVPYTLLLIS